LIAHTYKAVGGTRIATDYAQKVGNSLHRQEVDIDWYYDNMPDAPLYGWRINGEDFHRMGLEPWITNPDESKGLRYFVDRHRLPEDAYL